MINLEKKYLFCHVEKCGGTSMSIELRSQPGWYFLATDLHEGYKEMQLTGKMPSLNFTPFDYGVGIQYSNMHTKMRRWAAIEIFDPDEFFCFGFVRDPFTRCVSLYIQQIQSVFMNLPHSSWHLSAQQVLDIDPSELQYNVPLGHNLPNIEPGNYEFTFDWFLREFNYNADGTQVSDVCDHDNNIMLNFMGRFENMNEDWKKVCQKIGLQYRELAKYNSTAGGLSRETCERFYTPDLKEFLFDAYHDEFEVLGYEKR
tara:strand:- start:1597 stop:2367 length:771 start_codon:yes stop_codon:yes gene_type:complete